MTRPIRIRQRRTPGARLPDGAKSVTRGSRWGNPFDIRDYGGPDPLGACLDDYRRWLDGDPAYPDAYRIGRIRHTFDRRWVADHLDDLTGLDLACYCPSGERCHADELIRRANQEGTNS